MSNLDQPLKLKHGLAAAVAIMAVSITGTAVAGGGGGGGGGVFSRIYYSHSQSRTTQANSQKHAQTRCDPGDKVLGGGALSSAPFLDGGGMMLNTSGPYDTGDPGRRPDGWEGDVDVFANGDSFKFKVYAICFEKQ